MTRIEQAYELADIARVLRTAKGWTLESYERADSAITAAENAASALDAAAAQDRGGSRNRAWSLRAKATRYMDQARSSLREVEALLSVCPATY